MLSKSSLAKIRTRAKFALLSLSILCFNSSVFAESNSKSASNDTNFAARLIESFAAHISDIAVEILAIEASTDGCEQVLISYDGDCDDAPDSFLPILISDCVDNVSDLEPTDSGRASCDGEIICIEALHTHWELDFDVVQFAMVTGAQAEFIYPILMNTAGGDENDDDCPTSMDYEVKVYLNGSYIESIIGSVDSDQLVTENIVFSAPLVLSNNDNVKLKIYGLADDHDCEVIELHRFDIIGCCEAVDCDMNVAVNTEASTACDGLPPDTGDYDECCQEHGDHNHISGLVLRYVGPTSPATIEFYSTGYGTTEYNQVHSFNDVFIIEAEDRFGSNSWMAINGDWIDFHTSCSEPTNVGYGIDDDGEYEPNPDPNDSNILFIIEGIATPSDGWCGADNTSGSCNGSADVTPSGGTAPYSFLWSDGSTAEDRDDLCAGTYTVSVFDAYGCSAEITFEIEQEDPNLDIEAYSTHNTACGGGDPCDVICFESADGDDDVSAQMTLDINEGDGIVTIRTTYAKTFCDNTYGDNTIGWPSDNHTFGHLKGSDKLELQLFNGDGDLSLEFKMDYLDDNQPTPSTYGTGGVTDGDGDMIVGSASHILDVKTSLSENLNTFGYELFTNSPATDDNYTPNATYPNWIFEIWYEVTVDLDAFGSSGWGYPEISDFHASPSKTGNNSEPVEYAGCCGDGNGDCTGTIDLTVTAGNGPFTYLWSNGATTEDLEGVCDGTYTVTVTDSGGCSVEGTFEVGLDTPDLEIQADTSPNTACVVGDPCDVICFESSDGDDDVSAQMTLDINEGDGIVTIRTTYAKTFCDNTYGDNTIGWPSDNHTFGHLKGSDKLELQLFNGDGDLSLEFKMDYLDDNQPTPSTYGTGGVTDGDGDMIVGSAAHILDVKTSLSENLNTFGYELFTNSPATDDDYTPNATYPNWIFEIWYEVTVDLDAFGASGWGYPEISDFHASPSKTGNNSEPVEFAGCCGDDLGECTGSIDLTVTVGNGPFTYLWSNGATTEDLEGLCDGEYIVTVTDAGGCSVEGTYIVEHNPTELEAEGDVSPDSTCVPGDPCEENCTDDCVELFIEYDGDCDDGPDSFYPISTADCVTNVSDLEPTDAGRASCDEGIICIEALHTHWEFDFDATGNSALHGFEAEFLYPIEFYTAGGPANDDDCPTSIDYEVKVYLNGSLHETLNGSVNSDEITDVYLPLTSTLDLEAGDNVQVKIYGLASDHDCELFELGGFNVLGCCAGNTNNCVGAIDLTVTAGEAPFTFEWSNGETSEDIDGLCAGAYTVVVTDAGGCSGEFTFEVESISDCELIPVPDVTIDCEDPTDPSFTGYPDVECSNPEDSDDVVWTYEDETTGTCPTVITRTWHGEYYECEFDQIQVIAIMDNTPPVLEGVPGDETVECDAVPDPAEVTATDNCDPDVEVLYSQEIIPAECGYTIVRTWSATDNCDNEIDDSQTITVVDTTSPEIFGVPADETVNCDEDIEDAIVWATDNCDDDLVVALTSQTVPQDCGELLIRTWSTMDDCGNPASQTQTITIIDNEPPVITCPPTADVSCVDGDTSPASTGMATATDACGDATVSHVDGPQMGVCPAYFERVWTAIDECDNEASCTQIINIVDDEDPFWVDAETFVMAECDNVGDYAPTADDNCSGVTVTLESELEFSGGCAGNIERVYRATDTCGNYIELTQIIQLEDNTAPELHGVPDDTTIDCNDEVPDAIVWATDNCDDDLVVALTSQEIPGDCGSTLIRTWSTEDDCGNPVSETQTVIIVDMTPPVITCPADAEVNCTDGSTDPADTGMATATDDCSDYVITFEDGEIAGVCPASFERTWTATDDCDNSSSCVQVINVIDEEDPYWVDAETFVMAECDNVGDYAPTADDNCSGVTVTLESELEFSGGCAGNIERVYRATDTCGNYVEITQIIQLEDNTAPELHGIPGDTTIDCNDDVPDAIVWATDNCDDELVVSLTSETIPQACGWLLVRTWSTIDDCDNVASESQTVTVTDNTPPVITCPADAEVNCVDGSTDPADTGEATATDECSDVVDISFEDGPLSGVCPASFERVWTATDACNNSSSCTQIINVIDDEDPFWVDLETFVMAECDNVGDYAPTADDNCSGVTVTIESELEFSGGCAGNIERVYRATDTCGNYIEVTQLIQLEDNTAPELHGIPDDTSVDCTEEVPDAIVWATDNCDDELVVSLTSETVPQDCGWLLIRTWSTVDDCGNPVSQTQTVTVVDETAPVLSGVPADTTVECDNIPPAADVTATDTCDDDIEVMFNETTSEDPCEYTITRVWSAEDDCGNPVSATQVITVIDTTDPELSEYPEGGTLTCGDPLPEVPAITTSDNCDDDIEVVFEETIGDGDGIGCQLVSPVSPFYEPDWAVWLQDLPEEYQYYQMLEGSWTDYDDGSAQIVATVVSTSNPNAGFIIDVTFTPGMDWTTWQAQEWPNWYKDDFNVAGDNYLDWIYYIMVNEEANMTGWGDFEGSYLELFHAPSSLYYGYQLGIAANNVNSQYGSGGWFTYEGVLMDSSTGYNEEVAAFGDLAFNHDCCDQPSVTWTWTAEDCAGNSVSHSSTFTFAGGNGLLPEVSPGSYGTACPGDFDHDGQIAVSDLLLFLGDFGCQSDCPCDLDGDDKTTTSDLLIFLNVFGNSCE